MLAFAYLFRISCIVYLLHGGLGVERVDEDLGGIHARLMGDRLAGVLGRTGQLKGLGAMKC
jgi:hypothetical protein